MTQPARQDEILRLMREGWELRRDSLGWRLYLKESHKEVHTASAWDLVEKNLIAFAEKDRLCSRYELTQKEKP